jgi:tRNA pseudouridine38-40 synthase
MGQRIKLTVAYLGGRFRGWQRQPDGPTIQDELERALATTTSWSGLKVAGAGRTDAGVHAAAQAAHVDLPSPIPTSGLLRGLNAKLPEEITVRWAVNVSDDFHARYSARAKLYTYRARWRNPTLPWVGLRAATVPPVHDLVALERAARRLPGRRDMASFSVPQDASTTRTLYRVWLSHRRDGLDLHFVGDGFLRYQVRRMVGALLAVGRGGLSPAEFGDLLEEPRPGATIQTAPARGLTLERVFYRRSPLLEPE